jgi:hypothetical protein
MADDGVFAYLDELERKAQQITLDTNGLSQFFPEIGFDSQVVIYSPSKGYLSHLHKEGWFLGKDLHVISPFKIHHVQLIDYSGSTEQDVDSYFADPELMEWRKSLESNPGIKYRVFPSVYIDTTKRYDFEGESDSTVSSSIARSNLNSPNVLLDGFAQIEATNHSIVEVPRLIISDRKLLAKIQDDYPIASDEFRKMLVDSHRLAIARTAQGTPQNEVLTELLESVINPGVRKIRLEYKEMLKSQVIKAAAESVGLSLPFAIGFSGDVGHLASTLLQAGVGLRFVQNLLELRSNAVAIKKQPFYAAMKLSPW